MTEFDALTVDDLQVGDVLVKGGELRQTISRVTRVPETGETIIVTDKERRIIDANEHTPNWVRGSQWAEHVAAEEARRRADTKADTAAEKKRQTDADAFAASEAKRRAKAEADAAAAAAPPEAGDDESE